MTRSKYSDYLIKYLSNFEFPGVVKNEKNLKKSYKFLTIGDFVNYIINHAFFEKNIDYLSHPLIIVWDISNKCNLKCKHCCIGERYLVKEECSTSQCHEIIDRISNMDDFVQITLQGGEPFVRDDIIDIIAHLTKHNLYIDIATNGTLISKSIAKSLRHIINPKLFSIQVSLDGSSPGVNDKIRGNSSFELIMRGIRNLASEGFQMKVATVVMDENLFDLPNLYILLSKIPNISIGFASLIPTGRAEGQRFTKFDEALKILTELKLLQNSINGPQLFGTIGFIQHLSGYKNCALGMGANNVKPFMHCTGGKAKITIECDGDVFPCSLLKFPEFKIGNVLTRGLDEIWYSPKWKEIRKINRNTKTICSECDISWCNTGCMAVAYWENGMLNTRDPRCQYNIS